LLKQEGVNEMKIHITKQGESIDTIANNYAVSRQDLTGINPHVNLSSDLVPGLKLKIPSANRTGKNESIEQFFPNLDKEEAVPIGLKPFPTEGEPLKEVPIQKHEIPTAQPIIEAVPFGPEQVSPWAHLPNNQTNLTNTGGYQSWNQPFQGFAPQHQPQDSRAIIPPMPYYPPYPYPNPYYGYPPYGGYGYGVPLPLPVPVPGFGYGGGFGPGFGHGGFGGGFHGGGFHGGGHGGGHRFEYSGDQTTTSTSSPSS